MRTELFPWSWLWPEQWFVMLDFMYTLNSIKERRESQRERADVAQEKKYPYNISFYQVSPYPRSPYFDDEWTAAMCVCVYLKFNETFTFIIKFDLIKSDENIEQT